jgi:hypothetical protein
MPLTNTYKSGAEGAYGNSAIDGSQIASAARTTTGNGNTFSTYSPIAGMVLYINVSAASGTTPSLTVKLQDSPDGGTTWYDVASATAMTTTGTQAFRINLANTPASDLLRIAWTISGTTPSFTFKVDSYGSRQG